MGRISRKKLSWQSKNTSLAREKTFANGNNFLSFLFSFFVKQKFTNTTKSTREAWSLTTPLPPILSLFRHLLLRPHCLALAFYHITIRILWLKFSSTGTRNQIRMVINSRATVLQSRLTACYLELIQNLYNEPVEESDGRARFQFCHDITSSGEHAWTANTEEKKEKSYHHQFHNQKSRHSWNAFW